MPISINHHPHTSMYLPVNSQANKTSAHRSHTSSHLRYSGYSTSTFPRNSSILDDDNSSLSVIGLSCSREHNGSQEPVLSRLSTRSNTRELGLKLYSSLATSSLSTRRSMSNQYRLNYNDVQSRHSMTQKLNTGQISQLNKLANSHLYTKTQSVQPLPLTNRPKLSPATKLDQSSGSCGGNKNCTKARDSLLTKTNPSMTSVSSHPKNYGLNGLRNIGNTCFLNSIVQCLSSTVPLKEYLLSGAYLIDINPESDGALIKSFARLIYDLWQAENKVINTSTFKSQIQRFAHRFMGYDQQDAQEFLRYLLEGLHDDVNRVSRKSKDYSQVNNNLSESKKAAESWKNYLKKDNSKIVDLFAGQLKSTLKCTVCGHLSTTYEVFWDLSLPLLTKMSSLQLSHCLQQFIKVEVLDGDEMPTCSKCKVRRKCIKGFTIQKLPKILVLHLNRFSAYNRFQKLTARVEFPVTGLEMKPYLDSSVQEPASLYNLYAISNHSGTTLGGHYTAYCKHPSAEKWYVFNDSMVSPIGHIVSSEAYILFYEQVQRAR